MNLVDLGHIEVAFREHQTAFEATQALAPTILEAAQILVSCYRSGGKALFCGNGGSAADAQHIAAELVGRYKKNRKALPALALHSNTSTLTAVGNDYGYDKVFEREVEGFGQSGDVLVGLSTSGNSPNVVAAAQMAKSLGMSVIAMTGRSAGQLAQHADVAICIPADLTVRIQEMHIMIGHILCDYVEGEMFPS